MFSALAIGRWFGRTSPTPDTSQEPVSRPMDIPDFTAIQAGGAFRISVVPGPRCQVVLRAMPEVLKVLTARVVGSQLILDISENINTPGPIEADITMPALHAIELSGASKMEHLAVSGTELHVDLSGSAKAEMSGQIHRLKLAASGSSQLAGGMLSVSEVQAQLSGSAKARLHVTAKLGVAASGSASLTVTGNPNEQRIRQTGAARVRVSHGDQ
ncbi:GIN domain-containing protein [Achromobacter xylosoxidans]|uniref:GIN domain-containing protein n=1 Tax=Achromobacter anxifer TaxID=1287737 RepID=UPI00155C7A78|nr:DUF2807 domain-containing protein [Achromobacter anxifer]CAB5514531.1 hypothetical protein LMG26857_03590 [Achromobacter anxifer]